MTATASYEAGTKQLTVTGDGLPDPVSYGTFPNQNNPNSVTEQDFDWTFTYRGGEFGTARQFDDNIFAQTGFVISINISLSDNGLFSGGQIVPGDNLLFVFSDGRKQKFIFRGTTFTSIAGECWLAADNRLDLIVAESQTIAYAEGRTYTYYDQRNGRSATPLGAIGISANGVVFFNPSAGNGGNPPVGFNWNAHFEGSPVDFGDDNCGGHPEQTGQYHYHDTHFLDCWKDNAAMANYNDYYGGSQFNGDNLRHPDGHSKIVGFAFDGFPIYGPYGYDDPWQASQITRNMQSQYRARSIEVENRPAYGNTTQNPPAGSLMQDWEYVEGLGDLDYHNGRFCVTPEFPSGTYAYFLSTAAGDVDAPAFPYMVGSSTRETIAQPPNNGAAAPPAPPSGGGGTADPPTLDITLQPQSASVNSGQSVTFTIQAQILPENGPISYRWYRSTDGGFAYSTITGATNNSLTFTALAYMAGYRYKCEIRGPIGAPAAAQNSPLESDVVTLTVLGGGAGQTGADLSFTSTTFDSTTETFDGT
jgi:hypothetical protein